MQSTIPSVWRHTLGSVTHIRMQELTEGGSVGGDAQVTSQIYKRLETCLFSFLAGLRTKKGEHVRLSLLAALLDYVQLIPFVLSPLIMWSTSMQGSVATGVARLRFMGNLVLYGSYASFRSAFWGCVAVTLLTAALCIWTARGASSG